jgi:hypothetical protein
MEALMTKGRFLLTILTAFLATFLSSCSDQGTQPKPPGQSYNRVMRDYQYVDATYFDLVRHDTVSEGDLLPGDTIIDLQLFFSVNPNSSDSDVALYAKSCSLFVDPFNKSNYVPETVVGTFLPYRPEHAGGGTYWFSPTQHYVRMDRPVTSDLSIGAFITFRRNGVDHVIGSQPAGSPYTLKLIAHFNPQPEYVTWNYVWRNVYSLGGAVDNPESLVIKICMGSATNTADRDPADLDNQDGVSFIHLLGIDNDNDGRVDANDPLILDPRLGHLRFPEARPFASSLLNVRVNTLYSSSKFFERVDSSRYYILAWTPLH